MQEDDIGHHEEEIWIVQNALTGVAMGTPKTKGLVAEEDFHGSSVLRSLVSLAQILCNALTLKGSRYGL